VRQDVAAGLVSAERARSVYGVPIGQDDTATQALRTAMAAERGARPAFDFGPGRTAWEKIYGVAAEHIAAWMPSLPEGVRRHAQAAVYQHLRETGPGPYDRAATERVIRFVEEKFPRRAAAS
jgi:hypothetical protein